VITDDENPRGTPAERAAAYRRQIDALLRRAAAAAAALENPSDLFEMRRQLRNLHGLDRTPAGNAS
jgi:hypothetical protein